GGGGGGGGGGRRRGGAPPAMGGGGRAGRARSDPPRRRSGRAARGKRAPAADGAQPVTAPGPGLLPLPVLAGPPAPGVRPPGRRRGPAGHSGGRLRPLGPG